MRSLLPALLLLVVAIPLGAAEKTPAEKALDALRTADRLIYRPLDEGLKDLRLEFDAMTPHGKTRALWLYRAATKKKSARSRRTVKGITSKKRRRMLALVLKDEFTLLTQSILLRKYEDLVGENEVDWVEKTRTVELRVKKAKKGETCRIEIRMDKDGLPKKISWFRKEIDPDDPMEKETEVEQFAQMSWKKIGKKAFLSFLNSDRTGSRLIAEFEYSKIGGITLPSKMARIDPMGGYDPFPIKNIKVNEGITDEEFREL